MKKTLLLLLSYFFLSSCVDKYEDTLLEDRIFKSVANKTILLNSLTDYNWDTVRIAKPYIYRPEDLNIQTLPTPLHKELKRLGMRDDICILIFMSSSKVVRYAKIPLSVYDFCETPDSLNTSATICKGALLEEVKNFYMNYLKNTMYDSSKNEALREKYLTELTRAKAKVRFLESGGDPIIMSQDATKDAIETLKVKSMSTHWYLVSYLKDKNDSTSIRRIKLKARSLNDKFKITYIVPRHIRSNFGEE